MTPAQRAERKALVFHIMYGTYPAATDAEMRTWRSLCGEYINGQRDLRTTPLSLEGFREYAGNPLDSDRSNL